MRSLTLTKSFAKLPKHSILLDVPNPEKIFASMSVVSNEELQSVSITLCTSYFKLLNNTNL